MIKKDPIYINGNGETSRDFCFVKNVVQANLLAACTEKIEAINQVYNVALSGRTTLNHLFEQLTSGLTARGYDMRSIEKVYRDFRAGDVMHSQADITKARQLLGYCPTHTLQQGVEESLEWYEAKNK
jgi:UDP-N-acetylglucosamine 4-epimerase